MKLARLKGNVIEEFEKETSSAMLVHVCNNLGVFAAGVAKQIGDQWPNTRSAYLNWRTSSDRFKASCSNSFALGNVMVVNVGPDKGVVHMIAQRGIYNRFSNSSPLQLDHLRTCLEKVSALAKKTKSKIYMPKIGCGLARGTWREVEPIIVETISSKGIPTLVYEL